MSRLLKPKEPKRTYNRIARLPYAVRSEINRYLRDGWKLATVSDWIFNQKAPEDIPDLGLRAGDAYALTWQRRSSSSRRAKLNCKDSLLRWFRTGYRLWLVEEADRDESMELVERVEKLSAAAVKKAQPESRSGGNILVRSLLFDAINSVRAGSKDPAHMAQLANAWSSLDRSATNGEKLKLSSRKAVDTGLEALKEQIKVNPEALELFNKLFDTLTASPKPTS